MSDILFTERRRFEAGHYHDMPGFKEPRHGHNWEIEAWVRGHQSRLGPVLDDWVQAVERSLLNDQPALSGRNPTAEALAEWAFQHLADSGLFPTFVRIREKTHYWAACLPRAETPN